VDPNKLLHEYLLEFY